MSLLMDENLCQASLVYFCFIGGYSPAPTSSIAPATRPNIRLFFLCCGSSLLGECEREEGENTQPNPGQFFHASVLQTRCSGVSSNSRYCEFGQPGYRTSPGTAFITRVRCI